MLNLHSDSQTITPGVSVTRGVWPICSSHLSKEERWWQALNKYIVNNTVVWNIRHFISWHEENEKVGSSDIHLGELAGFLLS